MLNRDQLGYVHVTVPILLGGRTLGTLIAGQAFDQYPEQLPVERLAREYGLAPAAALANRPETIPHRPEDNARLWRIAFNSRPDLRSSTLRRSLGEDSPGGERASRASGTPGERAC